MSQVTGESRSLRTAKSREDVTMQALVIESIGRSPGNAWLADRGLVTIEGSQMRIAIGANRGLSSTLGRLERLDIVVVGEPEELPAPFDDGVGARLSLTKTGRRAMVRISEQPAGSPLGAECSCPLCTGPKTPVTKKKPPAPKPVDKPVKAARVPSRKSFRVRAAIILVREIDEVCRYCLAAPAETADHVRPLDRGGSHSPFNLVGCCQKCNNRKDNLYPKEAGMVLHVPLRWFTSTGLKLWRSEPSRRQGRGQ